MPVASLTRHSRQFLTDLNERRLRCALSTNSQHFDAVDPRLKQSLLTFKQGKRLFIKDMISYLVPPEQRPTKIAPSLEIKKRGIGTENSNGVTNGVNGANGTNGTNGANGTKESTAPFPYHTQAETGNPTIVPKALLEQFQFTFLIRDPHSSIPSYYRCTIPPLDEVTGFYDFYPHEAGYDELRRFFDFARESGLLGNEKAGEANGTTDGHAAQAEICLVDADDLLDDPDGIVKKYCRSVGLDFKESMLNWDNEEDQTRAQNAFEKWRGFHEDAINSKDLKPRKHVCSSISISQRERTNCR